MRGETVTLVQETVAGYDEANMPVMAETFITLDNVLVARVAPSVDADTGRTLVEDGFTLYSQERFVSSPVDKWIVRGNEYRSVGPSMPWGPGLSGWQPGTEVRVTRGIYAETDQ